MRWRKGRKILLDHPYFDFKKVMPYKESERIYNSGFPTFEQMIDGAKKRFDLPTEAWAEFDEVIAMRASKRQNRYQFKNMKDAFYGFLAQHKRLALICIVIILVLSFFTLIPFGRALAANFFNMVIRLFEGRIEITNQIPDYDKYEYVNVTAEEYDQYNNDNSNAEENEPRFYADMNSFVAETELTPLTFKADWLTCKKIFSVYDDELGITLSVEYATTDGHYVLVSQRWGQGKDVVFKIEGATYNKTIILGNKEFNYAIDPADGSFVGTALLDNSLIIVGAEKGVDTEKLIDLLK